MARILIVEDSSFMQTILAEVLTALGHEIVGQSTNGEDAVRQYDALKPDLVAMDLHMPQSDGISAIEQIMGTDPDARIVVVSAQKRPEMLSGAIKAGARDFLIKPLQRERLAETVDRILRQ